MTPPVPPPLDARLLLEHAPWMRRLARSLVGDPERAEDLSQETWRRMLERPPALDRPFRGWIATVMRNLARAERRGAARRAAREESGARPEAEPSSLELLERATLQRELVQAVLDLEEPYRTTVLLRYFEERTPAEIARREGIPVATVKTRLARGLARLRERLGHTQGPDFLRVLVALAHVEPTPTSPPWLSWTAASLAMNTKLLVPLGLALAAGLAWLLLDHGGSEPAPAVAAGRAHPAPAARAPSAPPPASADPVRRETPARAPRGTQASAPAPAGNAASPLVRGRVIDLDGRGVAGVEIVLGSLDEGRDAALVEARPVALAGEDGTFTLSTRTNGRLHARSDSWTTVLAGLPVEDRSGQECRIVVAPRLALGGVVVDENGAPVADAALELEPPRDLRARLEGVLDFSVGLTWSARSDERGRFRIEPAPAIAAARLTAVHPDFASCEEPAPEVASEALVLVLHPRDVPDGRLAGRVVDRAGSPVADAWVALGIDTTQSDAEGRFVFELDGAESLNRRVSSFATVRDDRLRAVHEGYAPAELVAEARDADGRPVWPTPLVLVLGGTPATIAGRVTDETGAGLAGMRVWVADPELLGGILEEREGRRSPSFAFLESLTAGRGSGWSWVESDEDGRFELGGLLEREYTLAALDPGTLLRTVEPHVGAGRRDVRLVLRQDGLFARLAGRVVDGRGHPVAHASIFPMCDALETRLEGQVIGTQHETVEGAVTDEDGRFELARVPEDLVYLRIQGADTIPLEWGRGLEGGLARLAGEAPEELEITVERRCHFQVELSVPAEADSLGVLDASGAALVVSQFLGNGRRDTEVHPILDGRSSTLAVSDRAATLVLYRAGAEVRRAPLRLEPGETVHLEL